ncbi:beta-propeller fold lactonase family protein [Dermatophilaceae bacterium Soc4.6]
MSATRTRTLVSGGIAGLVGLTATTALALPARAATPTPVGHVYEATNAVDGNAIQVFDQYADGHLAAAGVVASGGVGTGGSLHSQGGVVRDGSLLFAVNGGSDSVSVFAITGAGLILRGTVPSGGLLPVSVTVHDGIGYVLNQSDDTVSGFRYTRTGLVAAMPATTRSLTPNPAGGITDAAQVSFTPDGSRLLVTEKASNALETFAVRGSGALGTLSTTVSAGTTPYGFAFDTHGNALVSEAGTGSVSSYRLAGKAANVISAAVPDGQSAACWLVVAPNGTTAWAVNTGSHSLSSYAISRTGALTLTSAVAADTVLGGTDTTVAADGRAVYVRLAGGLLSTWAIGRHGELRDLGTVQGAPTFGTSGLASS